MGNVGLEWQWVLVGSFLLNGLGIGTALAQPIPDETLGEERSQVRGLNSTIDLIEGGATRGQNLFHSFREFNIDAGRAAYFIHQLGIENIFSRVTGGTRSEINGVLGIRGFENGGFVGSNANLFLINPNGIVFGPSSRLDVGGSFVATTANGIQFGDRGFFSATNPEAPSQLLTVNPSAFFFNQLPASSITVQSTTPIVPILGINGLFVPPGENLTLLGGDINIEGGGINVLGGRIDIGAVASTGIIGFNSNGSLNFPTSIQRGDVVFTDAARADVRTLESGGDIAITAHDVSILAGSQIFAGIIGALELADGQSGTIRLDATNIIQIDRSLVYNLVYPNAVGNAGNVEIIADALSATNQSQISASALGQGNAGNVTVQANDITLSGSDIFSLVGSNVQGNAGNITLNTRSVSLSNGSQLSASIFGQGNAGNVVINAGDRVSLDGFPTAIFSSIYTEDAVGQGGDIRITTGSFAITNGAKLDTSVFGRGDGGNIFINARNAVSIDGAVPGMERGSAIFSTVEETGIGSAGDIRIATGSLSITNGGNIQSLVRGQGNAGDITIEAIDSVTIDGYGIVGVTDQGVYFVITSSIASGIEDEETADGNGGNISVSAGNRITLSNLGSIGSDIRAEDAIGNAGNITLNANVLSLDSNSDINTSTVGQGDAGNIIINAREQLLLDNKAEISANTFGQGDAGDIIINARDRVSLDNDAVIGSIAGRNAIGDGGDIQITTGSLSIGGAAQLDTSTFGQGDAGDITIDARGAVSFDGTGRLLDGRIASSGILSTSEGNANGDGGNVQITAESLSLTNGATIGAYSLRQGNAGNITIDVRDRVSLAGVGLDGLSSRISSFTRGIGDGGTIRIVAESVFLTDGTQLTTDTVGQGNAGNVILEVTDQVSLTDGATLSSTVDENGNGNGGNIRIDATSLSVANGSRLNTSTSGVGNAGNISITASDRVVFAGSRNGNISGAFSTVNPEGEGEGGRIRIQTGTLSLIDGSLLQTGTLGRGNAGNIVIEAQDAVMLSGSSQNDRSRIFSGVGETGRGDGGNIRIDTALLSMENSNLFARTQGRGNAGNIRINASDRVLQDRSVISSIVGDPLIGGGIGEGGNVRINTGSLFLTNGSQLQASTFGNGNAGDIVVNARDTVLLDGDLPLSNNRFFRTAAFSIVGVTGNGNGGDIRIRTGSLSVTNGAVISAATTGRGRAGNIWINTRDRVLIDGVGSRSGFSSTLLTSTEQSLSRRGGTITVNTDLFQVTNGAIVNAQTFNRSRGGNIEVHANTFEAIDGGQMITTTSGAGRAGDITLNADRITISGIDSTYGQRLSQNRQRVTNQGAGSGLFANTDINSTGNGGRITVNSNDLTLENGARISAQSQGTGTAGDIRLNALEQLQLTDSDIVTTASRSSGGDITVNADTPSGLVILRGDSDITTNSLGDGGNITLRGSGIIAFDDSDILARSDDARGGNITLDAFFSQNPALDSEAPFDGNDRVDVNADGEIAAGTITTPDTTFIQNSLTELPDIAIDTDTLVANSCVVRSENGGNTFTITGTGGLPIRPGDRPLLPYGTNPVRSIPEDGSNREWQPGDAIVEPQGAYQLEDGRMVLSRECE